MQIKTTQNCYILWAKLQPFTKEAGAIAVFKEICLTYTRKVKSKVTIRPCCLKLFFLIFEFFHFQLASLSFSFFLTLFLCCSLQECLPFLPCLPLQECRAWQMFSR